mmetsp:Transcript_28837/g.67177  ORF Transcript_28837/g.67177 Transcript_28837/m.67177 type:complete len:219 (-) Transcript_28837:536-1192(-)
MRLLRHLPGRRSPEAMGQALPRSPGTSEGPAPVRTPPRRASSWPREKSWRRRSRGLWAARCSRRPSALYAAPWKPCIWAKSQRRRGPLLGVSYPRGSLHSLWARKWKESWPAKGLPQRSRAKSTRAFRCSGPRRLCSRRTPAMRSAGTAWAPRRPPLVLTQRTPRRRPSTLSREVRTLWRSGERLRRSCSLLASGHRTLVQGIRQGGEVVPCGTSAST